MTKKHHKIQSQESYWLEALSLFTDGCLNEDEMKQYKKDLAKRLADLVKNNVVLDGVIKCQCIHEIEERFPSELINKKCNDCGGVL